MSHHLGVHKQNDTLEGFTVTIQVDGVDEDLTGAVATMEFRDKKTGGALTLSPNVSIVESTVIVGRLVLDTTPGIHYSDIVITYQTGVIKTYLECEIVISSRVTAA